MIHTTLISTEEVARRLHDPALVLVDCRYNLSDVDAGERAFRAAHLPGARFLHLDRDLSGERTGRNGRHPLPDATALARSLGRTGIDASKQVVAYDQNNGMWASRLWWLLHWLGHNAAAVLDGGIDKWIAEGRLVTQDKPDVRPARFVPGAEGAVASSADIVRDLSRPARSLTIIDARAPERYRGDIEPLDPVAGHIPGAINRPYGVNLTPQGTFKPAELLRAEFTAQLGPTSPAVVIHQCGSGVTACHNVLAMAIAGLPGSRLYPGSWSEWVSDPTRPVVRGS